MSVTNICFHGIGEPRRALEPGEDRYWIPEELYRQVLQEIADRPDISISFDDGNTSDIEIGLGGLLQHGCTATFFVLAGRLDQPGSLSVGDVRKLRDHGMCIGSHGMDHVPWRRLSATEQHREFVEARWAISQAAGAPVRVAALPLGRYDRAVLASLKTLGYQRVYSSDRRRANADGWLQSRFSIRADDTIGSVRSAVLAPQAALQLLKTTGAGLVKRLR